MTRILIAEDDQLIASFLDKALRAKGYATVVTHDGTEATDRALAETFDLLILDIALPGREGFAVLQELRDRGRRLPVLVLTGRPELRDVAECLDVGADDYMTKPFKLDELLARVRARLRPVATMDTTVLTVGGISLDVLTRRVKIHDRTVDLTNREFTLLEVFMRHPDQVLSREQLLAHVWGYDFDPGTNVVNVYVAAVRRKLESDVIESVRGVGYRLRLGTP